LHVYNGFIGLQNVYLDTNNINLLHIVTKILSFKESEKWPPLSPGGASGLGPYLKIISRGYYISVPSFMLLTQNARFISLAAPLLGSQ